MKKLIAGVSYYDVEGLAEILSMSRHGIRVFIRDGQLKAIKIGRRFWVSEESLADFLEQAKFTPKDKGSDNE